MLDRALRATDDTPASLLLNSNRTFAAHVSRAATGRECSFATIPAGPCETADNIGNWHEHGEHAASGGFHRLQSTDGEN